MMNDLLGTRFPIIQAPMAGVQNSALTIAVSNAGGLGSLPCAMLDLPSLRKELATIKLQTTKPYNVNFFCHQSPTLDLVREARWQEVLEPYFHELGVDSEDISMEAGRLPFSAETASILEEFKPPVVSFHFGLPDADLVHHIRSWGAKVFSTATTIEEAVWLESQGVDAIIAQGLEAGGHRGNFLSPDLSMQQGLFALLPQVVANVSVPVIAAGGIACAKGVAAALKLGATAVQVGTSYLLCDESLASPLHRAALNSSMARHTAITNVFTGRPARGIINRLIREVGPINGVTPKFRLAAATVTALRKKAEAQGSSDFSPLWAGENTTGCQAISAADMTHRLAALL